MKFLFSILTLCTVALAVTVPQKAVIVSYPDNTPDSVLDQAKEAIKAAGGMITHDYTLIKGFAANAPAKCLEAVQAMGAEFNAIIEEDQMVSAS